MEKSKYEPRFLYKSLEKDVLPSKNPGVIHFEHEGALAYAALIIDYFLSQTTKADDQPAERLLSILTLFHDNPNYPRPQTRNYIRPSEYLRQVCLASDSPERLTTLMRSISSAIKQIAIGQIISINPYIEDTLFHAIGLTFARFEINGNKILAKQSPIPHLNATQPALIINWHEGRCLISADVNHRMWFLSLTPEKIKADLFTQDEPDAPIENSSSQSSQKEIRERYLQIKRRYEELDLPIDELQQLYNKALNHLIKQSHETYYGISFGSQCFFEDKLGEKLPSSLHTRDLAYNVRIKQELNNALARFDALGIIPELTLNARPHQNKNQEISYAINRQ